MSTHVTLSVRLKKGTRKYSDCRTLAESLERALDDVIGHRPDDYQRAARWLNRNLTEFYSTSQTKE